MALSPCLLVLALSVAHAGGGVPRGPSVQVEELAHPDALRAIELDPDDVLEAPAPDAALRVSPGARVQFACVAAPQAALALQPVLTSIRPDLLPGFRIDTPCHEIPCEALLVECRGPEVPPLWPPTELRWQAAPRRPWRGSAVPASSLPLFWLHERPPLTWPPSRRARPWHGPVPIEPLRPALCGGCLSIVVSPIHFPRITFPADVAPVGSDLRLVLLEDVAASASSTAGATSSEAR